MPDSASVTIESSNQWYRDREELIKNLREEANNVKDCFTKFSFQGLAFSGLVLGYIAKEQVHNPFISLAGLLVVIVALTVARIGTYKYATANRHYGFELHLERTKGFPEEKLEGWREKYWYVGWEEAMRAWRIVQATIYNKIYITKGINKDIPRITEDKYKWYNISINIKNDDINYHSGSYLKEMLRVLHLTAFVGLIPIPIASAQFIFQNPLKTLTLIRKDPGLLK